MGIEVPGHEDSISGENNQLVYRLVAAVLALRKEAPQVAAVPRNEFPAFDLYAGGSFRDVRSNDVRIVCLDRYQHIRRGWRITKVRACAVPAGDHLLVQNRCVFPAGNLPLKVRGSYRRQVSAREGPGDFSTPSYFSHLVRCP